MLGKSFNKESNLKIDYIINDIVNTRCEMFEKRKEKFWIYENGEF